MTDADADDDALQRLNRMQRIWVVWLGARWVLILGLAIAPWFGGWAVWGGTLAGALGVAWVDRRLGTSDIWDVPQPRDQSVVLLVITLVFWAAPAFLIHLGKQELSKHPVSRGTPEEHRANVMKYIGKAAWGRPNAHVYVDELVKIGDYAVIPLIDTIESGLGARRVSEKRTVHVRSKFDLENDHLAQALVGIGDPAARKIAVHLRTTRKEGRNPRPSLDWWVALLREIARSSDDPEIKRLPDEIAKGAGW